MTNGHEDACEGDIEGTVLENINGASVLCLPRKAKVVLLVIDALRYDFAVYRKKEGAEKAFENKLPVIDRLLREFPERTRLYKFIADPPTTTMQRLNALTTGSLPTFIDANSNFATAEINEDNVIDQVSIKKETCDVQTMLVRLRNIHDIMYDISVSKAQSKHNFYRRRHLDKPLPEPFHSQLLVLLVRH